MSNLIGKMSIFGGISDETMEKSKDDGLALYTTKEADLRPDMFLPAPADNPNQETWKRLRTTFPYIALRFDETISREKNQLTPYKITNPKTGQFIVSFLCDFGPAESTGRIVDVSPGIAAALRLQTDDDVFVSSLYE